MTDAILVAILPKLGRRAVHQVSGFYLPKPRGSGRKSDIDQEWSLYDAVLVYPFVPWIKSIIFVPCKCYSTCLRCNPFWQPLEGITLCWRRGFHFSRDRWSWSIQSEFSLSTTHSHFCTRSMQSGFSPTAAYPLLSSSHKQSFHIDLSSVESGRRRSGLSCLCMSYTHHESNWVVRSVQYLKASAVRERHQVHWLSYAPLSEASLRVSGSPIPCLLLFPVAPQPFPSPPSASRPRSPAVARESGEQSLALDHEAHRARLPCPRPCGRYAPGQHGFEHPYISRLSLHTGSRLGHPDTHPLYHSLSYRRGVPLRSREGAQRSPVHTGKVCPEWGAHPQPHRRRSPSSIERPCGSGSE